MFINCVLYILLVVVFVLVFYLVNINDKNDTKDIPPGPRGLPFFGHLLFFGSNPARTFMKWSKIYGPIFSLKFGSLPVVVLNDLKVIKETMSLTALSGRPFIKNWTEMCESKGIILADGPRQMEQRNFAIKTLGQFGAGKSQQDVQIQEEISAFLDHLKKKLETKQSDQSGQEASLKKTKTIRIHEFFQTPAINSIWSLVIGERFHVGDPLTERSLEFIKTSLDNNSGLFVQLTYYFSWLASILCFLGVNSAVNSYKSIQKFASERIQASKDDYVPGEPKHFTHAYFDKIAETVDHHSSFHASGNDQDVTSAEIFIAAIEGPTTTMDWLLLYMAREQQIQKQLQLEIDTVVGKYTPSNTPSFSHRWKMPYTHAVIQELLRISSALPLGVFRRAMEDIQINGYRIPKGTMVIPNQYGVHHDPEMWPEPDKFMPERFLRDEEDQKNLGANLIPFGSGKRICAGEGVARGLLFLFCTSFFQRFSIACTENIPRLDGHFGMTLFPHAFEVVISER